MSFVVDGAGHGISGILSRWVDGCVGRLLSLASFGKLWLNGLFLEGLQRRVDGDGLCVVVLSCLLRWRKFDVEESVAVAVAVAGFDEGGTK